MSKKTLNKIYIFMAVFVSMYLYLTAHNQFVKIVTFIPIWTYAFWYMKNRHVIETNSRKKVIEVYCLIFILIVTVVITCIEIYPFSLYS